MVTVPAGLAAPIPRVLVVDDEPAIRRVLCDFLKIEGFSVDTAPDGEVALSLLARAQYDVVISDLKMPKVGGLELLGEISRLNPEALTIVMTGFGTVDTAIHAMKAGAFNYLQKGPKLDVQLGAHRPEGVLARSGSRTRACAAPAREVAGSFPSAGPSPEARTRLRLGTRRSR